MTLATDSVVATAPLPSSQSYSLDYTILNPEQGNISRTLQVHATPEEIDRFAAEGFLHRQAMFTPAHTTTLRDALDDVVLQETGSRIADRTHSEDLFLRYLMDKHPAILDLLKFAPALSVARAMLGPQVRVIPVSARISYPRPGAAQFTVWHYHQRVIPRPLPPFFTRPHVIDCLIYLDDADANNGPLCVVPGSHLRPLDDLPWSEETLPGQVTLTPRRGDAVFIHGGLWHRALPTKPEGTIRRLIILPYCAAWTAFNKHLPDGLLQQFLDSPDADEEARELLGVTNVLGV